MPTAGLLPRRADGFLLHTRARGGGAAVLFCQSGGGERWSSEELSHPRTLDGDPYKLAIARGAPIILGSIGAIGWFFTHQACIIATSISL